MNESLGKDNKSKLPNDISPDDWNNHFTSVGPKLAKKFTDSQNPTWKNNTSIYQFKFTSIMEEDTLKMLQNLPSSNNIDVLGFDSLLLNLSSDVICSSLTVVFNMSLNTGQIPDDWKKARVTPIFKNKVSNTDLNNYRPISVIGHIHECFEKMGDVQFREYLLAHAFITESQSAFMKHHSTQTSLHHVIDSFLDNINHDKLTGVCLFDLAKCFDTIDHELLLHVYKLGKYGLTETEELLWFSNYLSDRSQIVNINGQLSSPKLIKTGVPQGSVLGPLLFLLFINDLLSCLSNATCNIFADDNMVHVNGTSIAEVETLLQKSVDESVKWFRMNKLLVNIDKCHVMLISGRNTSRYSLNIDIDGVKIPHVRSAKYLGVVINSELKWTDHINELSSLLSSRLYILRKLRNFLPYNNHNCIYYAIFQSCIDYCLSVWGRLLKNI